MSTVQSNILKLQLVIDPSTKNGQKFQGSSSAVTITNATNNGSGLIRITSANHGFQTGNQIYITGIVGTTEANNTAGNPNWTVTRISSSTFDLIGSTFSNAYTSGGTATGALVGSVDGANFTRQRILDIYNRSRYTLFEAMRIKYGDGERLSGEVGEQLVSTTITFSSASAKTTASKPTGYLRFVGLSSSSDVPYIMLPMTMLNEVRLGSNVNYSQSATNAFIFDEGSTIASYGTVGVNSGNAYVAGSGNKIIYYGITDFTLSDVLGNSTTETFNDKNVWQLLEIALAIATEASQQEINTLALKLIG